MSYILKFILYALIVFISVSPFVFIYLSFFSKNKDTKLFESYGAVNKIYNASAICSFLFFDFVFYKGIYSYLYFLPGDFGFINDYEGFTSYRKFISGVVALVFSSGILVIISMLIDSRENVLKHDEKVKDITNSYNYKLKLSYFYCKAHFEDNGYWHSRVRDKISLFTKRKPGDDLSEQEEEILKLFQEAKEEWYITTTGNDDAERITSDACLDFALEKILIGMRFVKRVYLAWILNANNHEFTR